MRDKILLLALKALITGLLRAIPEDELVSKLSELLDQLDEYVEGTDNPYDDLLKYLTEMVRETFVE